MLSIECESTRPDRSSAIEYSLYSLKSRRLLMVALLMTGFYCTISMRCHIGVAMVCMVNASAVHTTPSGRQSAVAVPPEGYKGSLEWSSVQQTWVLSASFYGNWVLMLVSGFLADRHGPRVVALWGMTGMALATALHPLIATRLGLWPFVALRFVLGIFENPVLPAFSAAVASWFPATERASVAALYTSGNQLAVGLGSFGGSRLCGLPWQEGWPLIFYLDALIAVVWVSVWFMAATNVPSESVFLSRGEKAYLYEVHERHLIPFGHRKQNGHKAPLRQMLTSPAVLAVMGSQFAYNFTNTLLVNFLFPFARDVLRLELKTNGVFTAVPFVMQLCSKVALGNLSDHLKKRRVLSGTTACRICQCLASFGGAIVHVLLAVSVDEHRVPLAFVLVALHGLAFGGVVPGTITSGLLIAPPFTGTLTSCTLVLSSFAHVLAPATVGWLVSSGTQSEWQHVFVVLAVVNVFSGFLFALWGSAEVQPWAQPTTEKRPT